MKSISVLLSSVAIAGLCMSASALAVEKRVSVSPFTDNLTVLLSNFPSQIYLNASYDSDNDVNISGPTYITTSNIPVVISSSNKYQDGFPSMTLNYKKTDGSDAQCTLTFVDGPWRELAYRYSNAPTCDGLVVSAISASDQDDYVLTITAK